MCANGICENVQAVVSITGKDTTPSSGTMTPPTPKSNNDGTSPREPPVLIMITVALWFL
jgi:hypothetical protein